MKTLRDPWHGVRVDGDALPRRSVCTAMLGILAMAPLAGCAGLLPKAQPKPGTLAINLQALGGLNPNANNRPSPVVVRLYELKASAQFESADFLSLYDKDQSLLAADIVARDEFVLAPGEKKSIQKPLAADTRFVGVVAAFRDLERARWRALVAVLPHKNNVVAINLDGIAVQTTVSAT